MLKSVLTFKVILSIEDGFVWRYITILCLSQLDVNFNFFSDKNISLSKIILIGCCGVGRRGMGQFFNIFFLFQFQNFVLSCQIMSDIAPFTISICDEGSHQTFSIRKTALHNFANPNNSNHIPVLFFHSNLKRSWISFIFHSRKDH